MVDYKCSLISLILVTILVYGKCRIQVANHCGDQVPCDNHYQCIPREKWCDNNKDCNDESDEMYCTELSWYQSAHSNVNSCSPEKHYICYNGQCVPNVTVCDGYENCRDGDDEKDCDKTMESDLSSRDDDDVPLDPFSILKPEISFEEDSSEITTLHPFGSQEQTRPVTTTTTTPSTTQWPTREPWISTPIIDYYVHRRTEDANQNTPPTHYENRQYIPNYISRPDENRQHGYNQRIYPDEQTHYRATVTPRMNGRAYVTPTPVLHANTVHSQYTAQRSMHPGSLPPTSFRAEYDTSRNARNSYSHQLTYPQRNSGPSQYPYNQERSYQLPNISGKNNGVLPPFYFKTNYPNQFRNTYRDVVQKAEQWLLGRMDNSYGWGKDTPRALAALSLVENSFSTNITDNNLMKKGLAAHLGVQLLNMQKKPLSISRLALYINALLATCQDPRNFLGIDVTTILISAWHMKSTWEDRLNPLVYLSLCLSNSNVTNTDLDHLYKLLNPIERDEKSKDRGILAITALACFQHQDPSKHELRSKVEEAVNNLYRRMHYDGSFGSTYSTALAAQALMSINSTSWDPRKTLDYLADKQLEDGSFGDMLATYYIMPALSGRSLVHLRNTHCDPPTPPQVAENSPQWGPGPKITVHYTLKVGRPERFSTTIDLRVPQGADFFSTMLAAQHQNPQFKFLYSRRNGNAVDVHTILDIPNDEERGYRWHLHVLNPGEDLRFDRKYTGSIVDLKPKDSQTLVHWYYREV